MDDVLEESGTSFTYVNRCLFLSFPVFDCYYCGEISQSSIPFCSVFPLNHTTTKQCSGSKTSMVLLQTW